MPASYLTLEVRVLVLPKLDMPLPVQRPSLDGLEALLVLGTLEPVTIKLQGDTRALSSGALSRPLPGELLRSHFLQKKKTTFRKLVHKELPSYEQGQTRRAYEPL